MQYKRIEGVTERHGYEFVEFKGEKVAFIAQQSLIDVTPIYFPKVRPVSPQKTTVWFVYRLDISEENGGVKAISDAVSKSVAVDIAEQAAIKE